MARVVTETQFATESARDEQDNSLATATLHAPYVSGVNISFTASTRKITRASGDFSVDNFSNARKVTIAGSTSNDGTYDVQEVGTTTLTLAPHETLVDEGPAAGITVTETPGFAWVVQSVRSSFDNTATTKALILKSGTSEVERTTSDDQGHACMQWPSGHRLTANEDAVATLAASGTGGQNGYVTIVAFRDYQS